MRTEGQFRHPEARRLRTINGELAHFGATLPAIGRSRSDPNAGGAAVHAAGSREFVDERSAGL